VRTSGALVPTGWWVFLRLRLGGRNDERRKDEIAGWVAIMERVMRLRVGAAMT